MIIECHAFKNCSSLEELNFSKNIEIVYTNILSEDFLPISAKIVVPDKLYDKWFNAENEYSKVLVCSNSDFIMSKITQLKHGKIIASIIYMQKAVKFLESDLANQILQLASNLKLLNAIDDCMIKEVECLLNMKEDKNG